MRWTAAEALSLPTSSSLAQVHHAPPLPRSALMRMPTLSMSLLASCSAHAPMQPSMQERCWYNLCNTAWKMRYLSGKQGVT